jgi:NAD(P)-dependent dehydrogenase (short-subunit alcohol dehydrogenase family)
VAIITGGARGLGLAFAEALAEYGADIAVFDVGTLSAEFTIISKKHNVRTSFIKTDVTDPKAIESSVAQVVKLFGGVDICVASAGIAFEEDFLTTGPEQLRALLAVNTEGLYYTNQSAASQMVKQARGGSIVNISSIAGVKAIRSQKNTTSYAETKGAVIAHTRSLAAELAPYGIRVNSIAPGFIYTDMIKDFAKNRPEHLKLWQDETMLGDLGARMT